MDRFLWRDPVLLLTYLSLTGVLELKYHGYQVNLLTAVVFLLAAFLFVYFAVIQTSMVYRCLSGVAAFTALVSSGCFYKVFLLKKKSEE